MTSRKLCNLPALVSRRWLAVTALIAFAAAAYLISNRWGSILRLGLGDTDDNMRLAQVRALIAGQGWYDLRQYKLDPPGGANIHWSRLVDLPIAALILVAKPFTSWFGAERFATAIAPLIPFTVALYGLGLIARRLIGPLAFMLSALALVCAPSAMTMFMPLRIDHHGWQLACLVWSIAGLADRDRARGGVVAGIASAMSLTIGLELLPYVAMVGAATALRWAWEREDAPRLAGYGASLGAGAAIGFALFASYANRAPVCDALSPVWLSVALLGGGLSFAAARLPIERLLHRVLVVVAIGAVVTGFYVTAWPHCVGMLEGLSPELKAKWFNHVREARPVYTHGWRTAVPMLSLPVLGLAGAVLASWRARGTGDFVAWVVVTLASIFALGMLLWQTRASPAAQVLAVPGATALATLLLRAIMASGSPLLRVAGAVAVFFALTGALVSMVIQRVPADPETPYRAKVRIANGRCPTLGALRPVARLPKQTVLTFVDFGPRLIAVTHHRAIAGPYHRNGAAILDVQRAFRGTPAEALAVMRRHGATLLLICPYMSESTIYAKENPAGFYRELMRGHVPDWLEPVPLPANSPLKLWRLKAVTPGQAKAGTDRSGASG